MKVTGRRIEIESGPDSLGRYHFTLYWLADYHPGHPDGENVIRERGQCFFATLDQFKGVPVKEMGR
jgi:hypothetical protein